MEDMRSLANVVTPMGSNNWALAEVTSTDPYTLGTIFSGPLLMDSNFNKEVADVTVEFEDGTTKKTSGTETGTFTITHGQQDGVTKDFFNYDSAGLYYAIAKVNYAVAVDGKYQVKFMPYCQIGKSYTENSKGFENERAIDVQNLGKQVVINTTLWNDKLAPPINLTCTTFTLATNVTIKTLYEAVV